MVRKAFTPTVSALTGLPPKQGLYDPSHEHDACGVGFVVNIKGAKSHEIVQQALTILTNLDHRGACGCEANTGDGAGILMQIPHEFLAAKAEDEGFILPEPGEYGVGMIFVPKNPAKAVDIEKKFQKIVAQEGQKVLGWRTVPTDNSTLGPTAVRSEPNVRQVFIGKGTITATDSLAFERKLFVIRKRSEGKSSTLPACHRVR